MTDTVTAETTPETTTAVPETTPPPTPAPETPPPGDQGKQPDAADWRAAITDEKLRDHAGRFSTVTDLVKGHADLREKLSRAIIPPGKDAKPEEIAAYRKAMDIPDSIDGYDVAAPEGVQQSEADKAFGATMAKIAHDIGMPAKQWAALKTALFSFGGEQAKAMAEAQAKADKEAADAADAALRKEWGKDYEPNLRFVAQADQQFGAGALSSIELKDGTLLGNHPAFMKAWAAVGRATSEGTLMTGLAGTPEGQTWKDKADEARAKRDEALKKGDRAEAQRWDKAEREALGRLYGSVA